MVATAKWKSAKLDELGFVGRGKSRHRPRNAAILYGGSYPFFQTGDIKAANFYLTEFTQTYSEEGLAQSKLGSLELFALRLPQISPKVQFSASTDVFLTVLSVS